jgi:hypothetical protein
MFPTFKNLMIYIPKQHTIWHTSHPPMLGIKVEDNLQLDKKSQGEE